MLLNIGGVFCGGTMSSNIILVTGGAGFIGANITREYIKKKLNNQQIKIHILVHPTESLWRLFDVLENIIVHVCDITDYDAIQKIIYLIKPTIIYHLASFGGMPHQNNQKIIFDVNVSGTINLFNACKDVGFDCFVNVGSSSEYGIKNVPMHEQMILEPVSDYAVSKAAATQFCLKEALINKLPVYTVRPFSVYGDYEIETRLIPTLLMTVIKKNEVSLSSPHFVRDFIYIKDIVDLFINIAEKKPQQHFIFNAGTGVQSSIQDVIILLQNQMQENIIVHWGSSPSRLWEPITWCADMTLVENVIGWKITTTLVLGIALSLRWFEANQILYLKKAMLKKNDAYKKIKMI